MFKGVLDYKISPTQKICLAGIFIAVAAILQKVLAINYIPIIPFLRISLGGPAIIIFSSIMLGPIYGLVVGAASDLFGYVAFDPKTLSFFPQITAIYALLGFSANFIFYLFKNIKNKKIAIVVEAAILLSFLVGITIFISLQNNLQLYGKSYDILLWHKICIPIILFVLFSGLFLSSVLFENKYNKEKLKFSPICISTSCFLIEILVMVIFGTLMKGWAFGFKTYPMILICQIIVLFFNIPFNTWLIILLMKTTNRFYKSNNDSI